MGHSSVLVCWWDLSQDSVAPITGKKTPSHGKWNACTEETKEILILCNHLIQLYLRLVLCDGTFACFNSSSCALKTRSKHLAIIGSISQTGKAFIQQDQYQNIRWPDKRIPSCARSSSFHLFLGHCELNLASQLNVLWKNHYYYEHYINMYIHSLLGQQKT